MQPLILLSSLTFAVLGSNAATPGPVACQQLSSLKLENTTIFNVTHVSARSTVPTPGSCQSSANVSSSICRIQFFVNTTESSSVHLEAWLPDTWFGRFLGTGNGGLGGCIDYSNLDYGSNLHFASVGSDNGHDGDTGTVFLNHPEVLKDFTWRAIHVEALIGKQIVASYYGRPHSKAYYIGCSTGGRQGLRSALDFPEDFDGIVAGAPAADFNHLTDWQGALSTYVGAPHANESASFIHGDQWEAISAEILRQCDNLDGVMDGIITEPGECLFRPEALRCSSNSTNSTTCLSGPQIDAVRKIYEPLFGEDGQLLYPQWDPGAEADGNWMNILNGDIFRYTSGLFDNTVYNDTNHSYDSFGVKDFALVDSINPGGISTWSGNLSAFSQRGGKFLTYHGRRDQYIASSNSKRLYDLVANTLAMSSLDPFYRLFLIPGMDHCGDGPGATLFGQSGITSNPFNDSRHNVLLAAVDWVEGGRSPSTIIGSGANGTRAHCRYPQRSVFESRNWTCVN